MTPLERSVLATLTYFDLFDYPLTLVEATRFRFAFPDATERATTSEVRSALDAVGAGEHHGYRFLPGREAIVDTRLRRFRLAGPKFRRARRAARAIGMLPSVRFVAVCNSLALSNADTESDIDMFVIANKGTVWITRLLVVTALKLFGLRPTERSHADKLCLSFFISDSALDLSAVALEGGDPYLRYWIASLVPLYDDGIGERFFAANAWIADSIPSWRREPAMQREFSAPGAAAMRMFDGVAKRIQERAFPGTILDIANVDTRVIISDDMLKFHVNDRRAEFAERFRARLSAADLA
jgi:hypothetical protein